MPSKKSSIASSDGSWSAISLQCSADPIYEWFISPNNVVVICSVGVISVIFLIIVSVIFTRRRRISSAHRQKMSRLRHHFDSNTKVSSNQGGR